MNIYFIFKAFRRIIKGRNCLRKLFLLFRDLNQDLIFIFSLYKESSELKKDKNIL